MDELSNDFFDMTLFFLKFVLITPGSIITTLIPNGSNSYDIDSLRPSKANLLLTYADMPGKPIRPAPELTFTIVPDFCFLIIGRTCCVSRITPKKLVSNCDLHQVELLVAVVFLYWLFAGCLQIFRYYALLHKYEIYFLPTIMM